jgi:hypothetical protein
MAPMLSDRELIAKYMSPAYPPGHGRPATGEYCGCKVCQVARSAWVRQLHRLPAHVREAIRWPNGRR